MSGLPDDPTWCGHALVDLTTWLCADCGRQVAGATRRRMEMAPTKAPEGAVWVLSRNEEGVDFEDFAGGDVLGVFTDRAVIARRLVRGLILSADSLRERLALLTWYQGCYNEEVLEGWGESPEGERMSYYLTTYRLDRP